MNILSDTFGIHEEALQARSRRLELLSANIANSKTPHFKARDVDFRQLFARAQQDALAVTQAGHFPVAQSNASPDAVKYRIPFNASIDGNTVEMSVEQAQYGKAATDYRASLMFIENRTSTLKRALRGE